MKKNNIYEFQNLCYGEVVEGEANLNISLSSPDISNVLATTIKELNKLKDRLSVLKSS